jgi:hypothetical protein
METIVGVLTLKADLLPLDRSMLRSLPVDDHDMNKTAA